MPKPPKISDAEWEVMHVLWQSSPLTSSEVVNEVGSRMQWHPKTVKTLLARLVRKGALRYRQEGNRYWYTPVHPRERHVEAESRSFLDRVFGGRTTPALVHFVKAMNLSDDDLDELRQILEHMQKEDAQR
jgi:BlaI family transcriptional regulator, penicillinase repressor